MEKVRTRRNQAWRYRKMQPVAMLALGFLALPVAAGEAGEAALKLSWGLNSALLPVPAQGGGLLSLDRLVAEIVINHPGVAARRAGVNEAEAGIDAAQAQYLPSPSIQINQLNDGGRLTSLVLSQPLWAAGRIDAGLDAARARSYSADGSLAETQNTLALRAADLYQSYLASRQRLAAQQAGMQRLQELVGMMRRRLEGGVSATVDHQLGLARLAQSRSDLALEEAAGRTLLAQLSQMAGRPLSPAMISTENPEAGPLESEAILIGRALTSHPAVRRTGADIEAALFDAEKQRAALWPTLSLQAERKMNSQATPLNPDSTQVYLTLQYQPGAGFSGAAQSRAVEARAASLRDAQEATRRELVDALQGDLERYRAVLARIGDARNTEDASREVLASYRRLFVAGKRGWLDVVNAARDLTQAELAVADLNAALAVGPYRLKLRTGDAAWRQE